MESSNLNDHLVKRFIKEDPSCECGAQTENLNTNSCSALNIVVKLEALDLPSESNLSNILLEGNPGLPETKNKAIFEAVSEFIISTKRFSK